jgi:hypothetical protein
MQTAARERLAKAQGDLVRALVAQGPIPAGFDEKMLRVAARSLVNKRRQQTARSWPQLAKIFGDKYPELFTNYAQSHSLPVCASPSGDGREFLRWMETQGPYSDAARIEAMAFDLRFASTPLGLRRRGGFALKLVKLRETRGFVLAVRLPLFGERWWRCPRKS